MNLYYTIPKVSLITDLEQVKLITDSYTSPIACDFEVAPNSNKLNITGLSSPEDTIVTHLGIASNSKTSVVILLLDETIRNYILDFLVTTDLLTIWHNAVFDFKHIYHHRNKLPKKYFDTRLFMKCRINNADSFIGSTSLKKLMRKYYGDWEQDNVPFTVENATNEKMIQYTGTDVCATFKLYELIRRKYG